MTKRQATPWNVRVGAQGGAHVIRQCIEKRMRFLAACNRDRRDPIAQRGRDRSCAACDLDEGNGVGQRQQCSNNGGNGGDGQGAHGGGRGLAQRV
jgi:hypothetical protein